MNENQKIAALEAELRTRKRTILFLVAEYAAQNEGERRKIISFLKETMPDLSESAAAIAREVLDAVEYP
ncbi:hypothetical protein [uncultured Paracoccus sp.]|uniref:hypothetical protein n=1 Tax=uncultured Paracoccus sp. TaxID=189685 RepID=UPI0025E19CD7|nr:hypothetical protein [uncultured Paracoccus sp.]